MTRWLKAFVCLALINLSLSVSAAQIVPIVAKGRPVMSQNASAFQASLVRRARARRRLERLHHTMRAVVPSAPGQLPRPLAFVKPSRPEQPPVGACAPPDHPPA